MSYLVIISIVVMSAIIHATFQLSVSTLTLMSGHALGRKTSDKKLTSLIGSFLLGVYTLTALLLLAVCFIAQVFETDGVLSSAVWAVVSGLLVGLGVLAWLCYYKRNKHSTSMWLPTSLSNYLTRRSIKTRSNAESFSLGMTSVIAEIIFIIGPLATVGLLISSTLPVEGAIGLALLYSLVSILPLTIIGILVMRGVRISRIQEWREKNKRFLQFVSGSGLIILGFSIYVNEVIAVITQDIYF